MARLERIAERLELKEFQLATLLDISKAINNNTSRTELLGLFERIVRHELGITRLMLFEHAGAWSRVLAYGHGEGMGEPDVDALFQRYTDIGMIDPGAGGASGGFDIAVPVFHLEKPLAFLLIGDIDEEQQRMSPVVKHLNFIQTLTNLIVVALENQRLAVQALARERERRDLELAAGMQAMLIPRELPDTDILQAAAWYQPHSQVGGDYYDLLRLADDQYALCVADVSGKGFAAALLMSNFQANLRAALAHLNGPLPNGFHQMLHDLNQVVFANARGERFVTLFLAIADLRERRLRYVSAGHNPGLLHHGGAITALSSGCIALGMMPSLPFLKPAEVDLPAGCTLLLYTDGLVEQEGPAGQEFGTAPMEQLLRERSAAGARAIVDGVREAYQAHRGDVPYLDDIALLAARFS
jgi:sigma-B regulation protein RsbU (phosphoserine phosphatase)